MNAEVPEKEIFINTFVQFSFLFFAFFICFIILIFLKKETEITAIIVSLIVFPGGWFLIIWGCSLAMLSRYNEVKTKLIELGFTITEIKNEKFKIIRDKEMYSLKVLYSTHLHLTLIFEDSGTSIGIESMDELVAFLSNKSQKSF